MRRSSVLALTFLTSGAGLAAGQQGATVEHHVPSAALANLQGEPEERSVLVYLPPSYDERSERRYPVVYLLHSFGSTNRVWLGGPDGYEGLDVAATLDSLVAAAAVAEMIVVMPDARTSLGGSWYADSPASGNWERFVADDVVQYVDSTFRTIDDRGSRGIAGQSMGAYGALRIAIKRPGVFGSVLAMSPVPAADPNPLGQRAMRAALEVDPKAIATAPPPVRVLWSRAAAFSPDPEAAPTFARLPYRLVENHVERVDSVWGLWSEATPAGLARSHPEALRRLSVRIEVGDEDFLRDDVVALSRALNEQGAAHELETFEGGHVAGVRRRFEGSVFQYFSRVLAPQAASQPIIDVHLHAYPELPPADDPMWEIVPEPFRADAPGTVEEHRSRTMAALEENNIVLGIVSGPSPSVLEAWKDAAPDRLELGAWLATADEVRPSVEELRTWFEPGRFSVLGELTLQYDGVAFDDERLMPYYAMAEELGIPVALHASGGPPGTPYFHARRFRVSLGDPISLEPVLLRFPDLKVYLMHAGHPFLDATKAILAIYPQVYVDTGVLSWVFPRAELYAYLQALVDAGFGDRIMFGSDQVFWPSAIGAAIEAVREAPFLSDAQKRAIFYDNAARFLDLPDSVRARHHADVGASHNHDPGPP